MRGLDLKGQFVLSDINWMLLFMNAYFTSSGVHHTNETRRNRGRGKSVNAIFASVTEPLYAILGVSVSVVGGPSTHRLRRLQSSAAGNLSEYKAPPPSLSLTVG